jgi:hypothetical protein
LPAPLTSTEFKEQDEVCMFQIKLKGITVCGRSVYRTDRGLNLGWRGPTQSVASFIADLRPDLAGQIRFAVEVIDGRLRGDLEGELAGVKTELAEAEAFMEAHGFSPTIGKRITGLEARKRDLEAQLAEARKKAATPLGGAWQEAKSLLGALDAAPDPADARLRLRACLRRMVEEVWLFVTGTGRDRIAHVEVVFAGGQTWKYSIYHRPLLANVARRVPGFWLANSVRQPSPDYTGLRTLKGEERDEASARFEAALVPAVVEAVEADLKARLALAEFARRKGMPVGPFLARQLNETTLHSGVVVTTLTGIVE